MTRFLFIGAFAIGAMAIIWIGRLFLGADSLGLAVTLMIAVVYAIGALELLQFRKATATLAKALREISSSIEDLSPWLNNIDSGLHNSVRMRVEGERVGLPAPVLTPYLVGLLVMLGLLGTFIGMVDTLKGAVVALEGSSELEAIRAGLAAPIEGLGLAFGTSVAGVAASAMLGLLSTLSRRERLQASHLLDTKIHGELSGFSVSHQQHLTFQAIQNQAKALPEVVEQLGSLTRGLETMGEQLSERLLANQQGFQNTLTALYKDLNVSVDQSLKTSLVESGELISSSIQPMAEKTLEQLKESTLSTHKTLAELSESQLTAVSDTLQKSQAEAREAMDAHLRQQQESAVELTTSVNSAMLKVSGELHDNTRELLAGVTQSNEQSATQQQENATQFHDTMSKELTLLRNEESERGAAAVERLGDLEGVVSKHLQQFALSLEEPMFRLIETASETPKAAADVIEKLRGEMTKNLERDNELLSERTRLMEQLDTLSKTLEESSTHQRDSIDQLIQRSADTLSRVGNQFGEQLESESAKLSDIVQNFANSSIEMASLGDAFNVGVAQFSESNEGLIDSLNRIEHSIEQSNERGSEQLAYYVAQAREIIDYNLLSQREVINALRAVQGMPVEMKEVG